MITPEEGTDTQATCWAALQWFRDLLMCLSWFELMPCDLGNWVSWPSLKEEEKPRVTPLESAASSDR